MEALNPKIAWTSWSNVYRGWADDIGAWAGLRPIRQQGRKTPVAVYTDSTFVQRLCRSGATAQLPRLAMESPCGVWRALIG